MTPAAPPMTTVLLPYRRSGTGPAGGAAAPGRLPVGDLRAAGGPPGRRGRRDRPRRGGATATPPVAPPPTSLDDASDDLAALLDRLGLEQVTVVGVSAGATLTFAFALRHPDRVVGALSHEPLLGPIAPELARRSSPPASRPCSTSPTTRSPRPCPSS